MAKKPLVLPLYAEIEADLYAQQHVKHIDKVSKDSVDYKRVYQKRWREWVKEYIESHTGR